MFNCENCANWAKSLKKEPCSKCTDERGTQKQGSQFRLKTKESL